MGGLKGMVGSLLYRAGYQVSHVPRTLRDTPGFRCLATLLSDRPNPVIFDVGAFVGDTAAAFLEICPAASIHCFEPFPDSFRQLSERLRPVPSVHCHATAVGDVATTRVLNVNTSRATNSLLPTSEAAAETWGSDMTATQRTLEIPVTTLDTFIEEHGIDRVSLLKIDVQGAEPLVLKGASRSLQKGLIDVVYTEMILQPTYHGQLRFDKQLGCFYDAGFDLHDIFNPITGGHTGRLAQIDAVFVRCDR